MNNYLKLADCCNNCEYFNKVSYGRTRVLGRCSINETSVLRSTICDKFIKSKKIDTNYTRLINN